MYFYTITNSHLLSIEVYFFSWLQSLVFCCGYSPPLFFSHLNRHCERSEAIQIKIKLFWVLSGSPRSFHSLAKTEFSLPARGAVKRSETEGLSIQDNLITRNLLDLITNLSRFFKFPCLDRFIKLDFEILENNFFFSFSCSLEFLYFTSCKRSKILI